MGSSQSTSYKPGHEQQQQHVTSGASVSASGTSKVEVSGPPGDRHLVVHLAPMDHGSVVAESGAMVWYDDGISVRATSNGGLKKAIFRFAAGESIVMTRYSNPTDGELAVAFAPDYPCDIVEIVVPSGSKYNAAAGAFLVAEDGIRVSGSLSSAKAGILGQGDIMNTTLVGHPELSLKAWIASNGIAERHDLAEGQKLIVDGFRVLLSSGRPPEITTVGGIKDAFLSGEGLAMLFTGPCTVWTQTRRSFKYLVEEIASKNRNEKGGFRLSLGGGSHPVDSIQTTRQLTTKQCQSRATTSNKSVKGRIIKKSCVR